MTGWKPYECEFCGAKVYTKALLDHHKWLLHGQAAGSVMGGPVTFRCAACGQEFKERAALLPHLALHRQARELKQQMDLPKAPTERPSRARKRRVAV